MRVLSSDRIRYFCLAVVEHWHGVKLGHLIQLPYIGEIFVFKPVAVVLPSTPAPSKLIVGGLNDSTAKSLLDDFASRPS
jgi:hypothetical protein